MRTLLALVAPAAALTFLALAAPAAPMRTLLALVAPAAPMRRRRRPPRQVQVQVQVRLWGVLGGWWRAGAETYTLGTKVKLIVGFYQVASR